jgi:hypothetical protein
MFLRYKDRRKDGKQDRYWSVVENTRASELVFGIEEAFRARWYLASIMVLALATALTPVVVDAAETQQPGCEREWAYAEVVDDPNVLSMGGSCAALALEGLGSDEICKSVLGVFARYGIDAKTVSWIFGTNDPRIPEEKHRRELAFVGFKCSDGVPRMYVRLSAGTGLLGTNATWMQFPEKLPVGTNFLGIPKGFPIPQH